MQKLLCILTLLVLPIQSSKKYKRKKANIVYEYLPQVQYLQIEYKNSISTRVFRITRIQRL